MAVSLNFWIKTINSGVKNVFFVLAHSQAFSLKLGFKETNFVTGMTSLMKADKNKVQKDLP